ncbi:MAG: DUF2061 domain-containing protein [archaeon]
MKRLLENKSLKKTFTFRLGALALIFGTTYVLTGNWMAAAGVGGTTTITNTAWYYIHEEMWKDQPKEPEQKSADKEWLKHGIDNF